MAIVVKNSSESSSCPDGPKLTMRILHVADLHLHKPWLDWVSSNAKDFGLVVVAGDVMNAFSDVPLREQMRLSQEWLIGIPAPVLLCSGNHDHWVKDARVSIDTAAEGGWLRNLRRKGNVIAVDGDVVTVGGVKIAVAGWLRPRWPQADIVIYHAPPAGCSCAGSGGRDVGDQDAADQLVEHPPRLFLSGHVHEGKPWCWWPPLDRKTLVLVPGCTADNQPPAHWAIDYLNRTASHVPSGESVGF